MSSFNCKQSEVPFAMTKETKQDRGERSRILQLTTSVQFYSKKNKRQLVSGSIEQLCLKAAHGFLRDQYLQVDGEW